MLEESLDEGINNSLAKQVRFAAMNLLARREYSFFELNNKLVQRFDETIVSECLQRLADENLQSDQRFTENYTRSLVNKGKGPFYIRQKLQNKGIAEPMIESELASYKNDWFAIASDLYSRKYTAQTFDLNEKAKRYRFLKSRGFSADVIKTLID